LVYFAALTRWPEVVAIMKVAMLVASIFSSYFVWPEEIFVPGYGWIVGKPYVENTSG
jgi:hypothetical protein